VAEKNMQVVLTRSTSNRDRTRIWSLTKGVAYEVVQICCNDFRIVDDTGEPHLFDADCFVVVDGSEPSEWESRIDADGDRYAGPPKWSAPGFFEDYFDRDIEARRVFWETHARIYERRGSSGR
jgi:hypothetical protein